MSCMRKILNIHYISNVVDSCWRKLGHFEIWGGGVHIHFKSWEDLFDSCFLKMLSRIAFENTETLYWCYFKIVLVI